MSVVDDVAAARSDVVMGPHSNERGSAAKITAVALAVGIALRVVDYLRLTSFNIDEARVALNVGMRSYLHLLPPLDHDQSAPLLFLWAEKLVAGLLGMNELALRIVPLIAGIATIALLVPAARRFLEGRAAILALALVACAPGLVQYSATLKQYAVEAFATVLLLKLFADWWVDPQSRRARLALVIGGALSVWLAAPAVFMLAGVWSGIFLTRGRSSRLLFPAAAGLAWGVSFIPAYVLVYRSAALNPYMKRFWEPSFLHFDNSASLLNAAISLRSLVWGAQIETLPFIPRVATVWLAFHTLAVALGCISLLGALHLARRNGAAVCALVMGPLLAVGVAAALGLYPVARRTTLFILPLVIVAIAGGLAELIHRLPARYRGFAWAATAVCVLGPNLVVSTLSSLNYNQAYPLRPMVAELQQRRRSGEPLYISAGAIPAWTYYSTDWTAPDTMRVRLLNRLAAPTGPAFENAPSRGRPVSADEGRDLHYATAWGPEFLGLPSGIESWALVGPLGEAKPDTGWAAHEAARIRAAADSTVWVLMSQHRDIEMELLDEIERCGGHATFLLNPNGAVLARYEFREPR
jgi:hypothetical protein